LKSLEPKISSIIKHSHIKEEWKDGRKIRCNRCRRGLRISTYDYIDRFAPQLGLSREAIERAHKFYKALPRNFTQSKSPLFLAAMALYIAAGSAGEKITLDKVARTVGVGISGISKNLKRARQLN
jgi:transcription initiation factor TFIIIB Brf1 subunit/transcription initiation factor TFIIB